MIEINLLPEELKIKSKQVEKEEKFRTVLYIVALIFASLILLHISLLAIGFTKNYQQLNLSKKWKQLEPQRKLLEELKREYQGLSSDTNVLAQLFGQSIDWAAKLNKLSLNLARGIWFNELSISQKTFTLKGSVVSLQKKEFGLLEQFMNSLKNDKDFMKNFSNIELGSIQRRTIGGYDIVDFVLTSQLK